MATKRATVSRGVGRGGLSFLRFQPGNVVIRQFFQGVEGDKVPAIGGDAFGFQPRDDPIDLALIFRIDLRREHFLGGVAIEVPVVLGGFFKIGLADAEKVGDFGGKQVAVLKAHLLGRTFEMSVDPAVLLGSEAAFESGVSAGGWLVGPGDWWAERQKRRAGKIAVALRLVMVHASGPRSLACVVRAGSNLSRRASSGNRPCCGQERGPAPGGIGLTGRVRCENNSQLKSDGRRE